MPAVGRPHRPLSAAGRAVRWHCGAAERRACLRPAARYLHPQERGGNPLCSARMHGAFPEEELVRARGRAAGRRGQMLDHRMCPAAPGWVSRAASSVSTLLKGYPSESGLLVSKKGTKASRGSSDSEVGCDSRSPVPGMGSVPPSPPSPSTSLLTQRKPSSSLVPCS